MSSVSVHLALCPPCCNTRSCVNFSQAARSSGSIVSFCRYFIPTPSSTFNNPAGGEVDPVYSHGPHADSPSGQNARKYPRWAQQDLKMPVITPSPTYGNVGDSSCQSPCSPCHKMGAKSSVSSAESSFRRSGAREGGGGCPNSRRPRAQGINLWEVVHHRSRGFVLRRTTDAARLRGFFLARPRPSPP